MNQCSIQFQKIVTEPETTFKYIVLTDQQSKTIKYIKFTIFNDNKEEQIQKMFDIFA